ncbi:MAG: N(5)-(carboxyethyl)ornithine synthase [Candidatus Nanopelagicales bacterium]|nr:N(5)-(carboxyethyl)ornithine synthase [Candidatus Nanopelagicales bacterium]MDZ4250457.1 N(5)-(carboxyethyl)ornithine synthase [Candidatus Nanopelagicales bacterium]
MKRLTIGVLAASGKENEQRLPIHPRHLSRIDPDLRGRMIFEAGYGSHFGVPNEQLKGGVAGVRSREEILAVADVVLLPKPTLADVAEMRDGQVLWGWPHVVQDPLMTQLAIDKRLTLIAWEAMNVWGADGSMVVHVFHMNNELAGYCSVLHSMTLAGITGHYGRQIQAAVIGFGNSARGAATGLRALGIHDITALTQRGPTTVASPIPSVVLERMERDPGNSDQIVVLTDDGPKPIAQFLSSFEVVVNCVLQDTDAPQMFIRNTELSLFEPGTLLVDVSCDAGMGFEFARPTAFDDPVLTFGNDIRYYGVDHSPSYLWNSATWEISEALMPYLRCVMDGPDDWEGNETIRRAIEIRDGVIVNPKILSFQSRSSEHPHERP